MHHIIPGKPPRGDRAEYIVRVRIGSGTISGTVRNPVKFANQTRSRKKGATGMNNGDENHAELLTVHEIARLLKVPVSWVYGHTRKRFVFGPKWNQVQVPTQTTSGRIN